MGNLLTILLQHNAFRGGQTCDVLRPLWADEPMHRSYNLLRLMSLLKQRIPLRSCDCLSQDIELSLAANIAEIHGTLATVPERQLMPRSPALREMVVDLVELFGPAIGLVELTTEIERLSLPGFQRRALVLAASELVMIALLHAFKSRRRGRLIVRLQRSSSRRACLTVADDGTAYGGDSPEARSRVAADLAGLLASTLVCRQASHGGTIAQIDFALDAQESSSQIDAARNRRRPRLVREELAETLLRSDREVTTASVAGVRE